MPNSTVDFQQAKAKHLQFKTNLRLILYGEMDIDETPVLSEYECAVGKWIYNYAIDRYRHIPEMSQLEKVHAEIHNKARHLLDLFRKGEPVEARSKLTEIEDIADRLVGLLNIIEQKIANGDSDGHKLYQSVSETKLELTELIKKNEDLDKLIKRQSLELSYERQNLKDLFMQFPAMVSIIKGKDLIIEMSNDNARKLIGKNDINGKPLKEVLPELESQGFIDLINTVYAEGKTITQREVPVNLNIEEGGYKTIFVDFSMIPLKDVEGKIQGVISFSYDVTFLVESRKKLEETVLLLQHANDDLETKVKFRNIELERENKELLKKLEIIGSTNAN